MALAVPFLLVSSFPETARAAGTNPGTDSERAARLWQPGLSLFFGGLPNLREASGASDTSLDQDGETVGLPWVVGGSLEVASPVVLDAPIPIRLFAHGGAGGIYDPEDPVTSVGDPGSPPFESSVLSAPESIENVGSAVRAESKSWMLMGGLGAVLELEAFDRTIYLRPSLEWMYQKDTIRAVLGGGEAEALDANDLCAPCRTLFIDAETEKGYHSLGPGIAAEVDGAVTDDYRLRFFASFAAYRILGDRDAVLSASAPWVRSDAQPTARVPAATTFDTRYERAPWHYRFGVGLRLVWLPR